MFYSTTSEFAPFFFLSWHCLECWSFPDDTRCLFSFPTQCWSHEHKFKKKQQQKTDKSPRQAGESVILNLKARKIRCIILDESVILLQSWNFFTYMDVVSHQRMAISPTSMSFWIFWAITGFFKWLWTKTRIRLINISGAMRVVSLECSGGRCKSADVLAECLRILLHLFEDHTHGRVGHNLLDLRVSHGSFLHLLWGVVPRGLADHAALHTFCGFLKVNRAEDDERIRH